MQPPSGQSRRSASYIVRRIAPPVIAASIFALPVACRDAVEPETVRVPNGASLAKGGGGGGGGGKPGPKIVFESARNPSGPGDSEIYVMNADGGGLKQLTNSATGANSAASTSADGSRIAFQSTRDGNNEIYVMNADGSAQTNVSNNATASDIETLGETVRKRVKETSGVTLDWEIKRIGVSA